MDNLTHSLTALLLVRAGLHRLSPRAAFIAVAAANLPDADVAAALSGSHAYLDAHRGITHSVFALPVMAAIPAAAAGLVRAPTGFPWLRAWLLSVIALVSHLLLDWTNVYGIRMLLPFSAEWLRLDINFIVDLLAHRSPQPKKSKKRGRRITTQKNCEGWTPLSK